MVVVGGGLQRDPGARIGGEVEEVGVGPININPSIDWPRWGWGPGPWFGNPFGGFFSLISTVVRVGILCLLTAIVLLLGSGYVDRIRTLAAAEPLKAGAVGFLSQVLMVPLLVILTIVLIITIVGIPFLLLLPFAVLALAVLALVGFTAVAREVGQKVLGRVWATTAPASSRSRWPACCSSSRRCCSAGWSAWAEARCGSSPRRSRSSGSSWSIWRGRSGSAPCCSCCSDAGCVSPPPLP